MADLLKDQLPLFGGASRRKEAAQPAPGQQSLVPAQPAVDPVEPAAPPAEPAVLPAEPAIPPAGPVAAPVEPIELREESPEPTPLADAPAESVDPAAPFPSVPDRPGEQYLFPPQRRRRDLPFSRRMSDLVRRLQLMEREAKTHLDLTLPQAHAIHTLMDAGSLRMQELAASLGLAQSTVTRLVAPLKRMGLLDRRPDRADGRATRAFLTDNGVLVVDSLDIADRQLYQGLLDRLPETRRAEVIAAIELLHEAVLDVAEEH